MFNISPLFSGRLNSLILNLPRTTTSSERHSHDLISTVLCVLARDAMGCSIGYDTRTCSGGIWIAGNRRVGIYGNEKSGSIDRYNNNKALASSLVELVLEWARRHGEGTNGGVFRQQERLRLGGCDPLNYHYLSPETPCTEHIFDSMVSKDDSVQ
jgi:hypothetical protein